MKKAEESLTGKKRDLEGQKEEVERGGRELDGMEGEVGEIRARREKVSLTSWSLGFLGLCSNYWERSVKWRM